MSWPWFHRKLPAPGQMPEFKHFFGKQHCLTKLLSSYKIGMSLTAISATSMAAGFLWKKPLSQSNGTPSTDASCNSAMAALQDRPFLLQLEQNCRMNRAKWFKFSQQGQNSNSSLQTFHKIRIDHNSSPVQSWLNFLQTERCQISEDPSSLLRRAAIIHHESRSQIF